jgi:hypothetical protein
MRRTSSQIAADTLIKLAKWDAHIQERVAAIAAKYEQYGVKPPTKAGLDKIYKGFKPGQGSWQEQLMKSKWMQEANNKKSAFKHPPPKDPFSSARRGASRGARRNPGWDPFGGDPFNTRGAGRSDDWSNSSNRQKYDDWEKDFNKRWKKQKAEQDAAWKARKASRRASHKASEAFRNAMNNIGRGSSGPSINIPRVNLSSYSRPSILSRMAIPTLAVLGISAAWIAESRAAERRKEMRRKAAKTRAKKKKMDKAAGLSDAF